MNRRLSCPSARRMCGFTLVELLVVIAIIAVLLAVLLPSLSGARRQAQNVVCLTHLRELGAAFGMYADDYDGRAMPLAYWTFDVIGSGPAVYWWGTNEPTRVDAERGFIWPYLRAPVEPGGVLDCPMQSWGSYEPQGAAQQFTSTYGYNGYYLSPLHTPGWGFEIGHRPWQSLNKIRDPSRVMVFADTLSDLGADLPRNNALLDPPQTFSGGAWSANEFPTTSFRHGQKTQSVLADGHAESFAAPTEAMTSTRYSVGSVNVENGPHYVPDWRDWTAAP